MLSNIPAIYLAVIAIIIGFVGLIWSADRFVAGAASIAKSFGVAPMIIGLTIVSFGTSAPEVVVSISASLKQAGDIAVGNALGSNIANIGLVLAATLLISKIPVQTHLLKSEMPILILVTLLGGYFLYDATIQQWEGWTYLILLVPTIWLLVKLKQNSFSPNEVAEEESEIPEMSVARALAIFFIGLVLLIISSEILVWGAKTTAEHFNVSPLIIGLTVIAIGTSLPELAASIASAVKGHHDIAVGNIIGSNIFNLMAVMAIPGIVYPPSLDAAVFSRDYMTMLGITLILAGAIWFGIKQGNNGQGNMGRATGSIMLLAYFAYYLYLFGIF